MGDIEKKLNGRIKQLEEKVIGLEKKLKSSAKQAKAKAKAKAGKKS
jgi:hypothetical protein